MDTDTIAHKLTGWRRQAERCRESHRHGDTCEASRFFHERGLELLAVALEAADIINNMACSCYRLRNGPCDRCVVSYEELARTLEHLVLRATKRDLGGGK